MYTNSINCFFQTFTAKLGLCLFMVVFADWLFFDEPIGWTTALYSVTLITILSFVHKHLFAGTQGKIAVMLLAGLLASLLNNPTPISSALLLLGIAFLIIKKKKPSGKFLDNTFQCLGMIAPSLIGWIADLALIKKAKNSKKLRLKPTLKITYFIIPLILSAAFIYFFAQANPFFAKFFHQLNINVFLNLFSFWRLVFWASFTMFVWSYFRPKLAILKFHNKEHKDLDKWFSQKSITLSLILFNLIFAAQNSLDLPFLLDSTTTLPSGLTYAQYARAGAYPLIITILLAAGYVLLVFDERRSHYHSKLAENLVYLWLAQNILLLISAFVRNYHYVEYFSLTYMRLSAFIWMGLIATGLLLIIGRISLRKSNTWLVSANILALLGTLYICSFINFSRHIAFFNVNHSFEKTGDGQQLDLVYMAHLGTQALPALIQSRDYIDTANPRRNSLDYTINDLQIENANAATGNWRGWTYREYILYKSLLQ